MIRPREPERTTEPILGFRAWRIRRNERGLLRIAPSTPRTDWEPGVAQVASCSGAHTRMYMVFNPELAATHRSPEPGCTCGFHAVKDPARLARAGRAVGVVGRVAMWGRVIEHSKGWRAEFVYPSRLRLVCGACLWRGRLPAVPDRVLCRGERMTPVCATHAKAPWAVGEAVDADRIQSEMLSTYGVELLPVEALASTGRRSGDLITRFLRAWDTRER